MPSSGSQQRIHDAYASLLEAGTPAVHGEVMEGDVAGYHYYPGRAQVVESFTAEGLQIIEEAFKQDEGGWGYHRFLLRDRA